MSGAALRVLLFNAGSSSLKATLVEAGGGRVLAHASADWVRIAPELRSRIAALAELAPLHNPPGLETLASAEAELPDVPHVAVFDTAFHASLPPAARTYAVPEEDVTMLREVMQVVGAPAPAGAAG